MGHQQRPMGPPYCGPTTYILEPGHFLILIRPRHVEAKVGEKASGDGANCVGPALRSVVGGHAVLKPKAGGWCQKKKKKKKL